jgi:hypothetical protein
MGRTRPRLTVAQILAWADAHQARTGRWPSATSGPVGEAPGETWQAINQALRGGWRGLPAGDSLVRLLARHGRRPRQWAVGPNTWTAAEDDLLRRLPPAEVARRTGRTVGAVCARRSRLGLPDARRQYR